MATVVQLEFGWVNSKRGYICYKPKRDGAEWATLTLNKEFRNQCLHEFKPKGTRAMLVLFEEGEEE